MASDMHDLMITDKRKYRSWGVSCVLSNRFGRRHPCLQPKGRLRTLVDGINGAPTIFWHNFRTLSWRSGSLKADLCRRLQNRPWWGCTWIESTTAPTIDVLSFQYGQHVNSTRDPNLLRYLPVFLPYSHRIGLCYTLHSLHTKAHAQAPIPL